uniref:Uncharacterized protein n=1 Tax=Rhizophora mucronata TaxID=61149 RepID=A0A2P2J3L7_RHIMU
MQTISKEPDILIHRICRKTPSIRGTWGFGFCSSRLNHRHPPASSLMDLLVLSC